MDSCLATACAKDFPNTQITSQSASIRRNQRYRPLTITFCLITRNFVMSPISDRVHFTSLHREIIPDRRTTKRTLRITDLETHFADLNGQSALILGCHDLTMFNPRSNATAKGWRADVEKAFKAIASRRKPTIVLHHPHTTVKQKTWSHAWNRLRRELPSVQSYLGTGCYSIRDPKNGFKRDEFDDVLKSTASPDVLDVVVQLGRM